MQNFFKTLYTQLTNFLTDLTPIKRYSLMASFGVVLASFITIVMITSGTDYVTLLPNVSTNQIPSILNILRTKKIPHRVSEKGGAIMVPQSYLHSSQMIIMSEAGSGRIGTIGLELFDKQDFATTSYAQKINYQRALQGELSRAINSLESVARSKVILALPKRKTFLSKESKSSASVVVELEPGQKLTEDQVRGITYLVSNAVENMDISHVTVVDSRGKILSEKYDPAVAGSAQLMDIKKKVDSHFEERIESIIARVVGEGKVIARVNSTLNSQRVSMVREEVDPDRTAVRSIQTEAESSKGNRSNPTGVTGARANIPGSEESQRVNFNQDVNREIKTTNYAVPKTVKNIVESAGTIKRISVAVMVDGIWKNIKGEDGKSTNEWVPREEEELARFEKIVKNAIGFDNKRGDSISIESFKFQQEDFAESDKLVTTIYRQKLLRFLASWVLAACSLIMIFFLLIKPFISWVTDSLNDSSEQMLPKTIEELEELHGLNQNLEGIESPIQGFGEDIDPEKAEAEIFKQKIMDIVKDDEEKASSALSLWLVRRNY